MASTDTTAKARHLQARFPHLKHTQALRLVHEGRTRGQEIAGWDIGANAPVWADEPTPAAPPMGPSMAPRALSDHEALDRAEAGIPSVAELGNVAVCGTVGAGASTLLRQVAASAVTEGWDVVYVTAHPREADAIPKGATPVFVDP